MADEKKPDEATMAIEIHVGGMQQLAHRLERFALRELAEGDTRERLFAAYMTSAAAAVVFRAMIATGEDAPVLDTLDPVIEQIAQAEVAEFQRHEAERKRKAVVVVRPKSEAATASDPEEVHPTQAPAKA